MTLYEFRYMNCSNIFSYYDLPIYKNAQKSAIDLSIYLILYVIK